MTYFARFRHQRLDRMRPMPASPRVGPPPPHIIETEIDDEVSLYNPHDGSVLVLNLTASDVWRLCDGEQTLEEIVEMISRAYRVKADSIREDVAAAVSEFVQAGFVPWPE